MKFAKHAIFDSKKNLNKHSQSVKAKYEKVFSNGDCYIRFFSDEKAICVGQYISHVIGNKKDKISYIGKFKKSENKYYFCIINNGFVELEREVELSQIVTEHHYDISTCDYVYIQNDLGDIFDNEDELCDLVIKNIAVNLGNIPSQFYLDKAKDNKKIYIALAVFAVVLGGVFLYPKEPPKKIVTVKPKTPIEIVSDDIQSLYPADQFFETVAIASSYANLLPKGWVADDITSSGDSVSLQILNSSASSNLGVLDSYFSKYKELMNIYEKESKIITFSLNNRSNDSVRNINGYPDKLHDQLVAIGADEVSILKVDDTSWNISASFSNKPMALLSYIHDLLKDTPVYINTFSESGVSTLNPSFSFDISIRGVQ